MTVIRLEQLGRERLDDAREAVRQAAAVAYLARCATTGSEDCSDEVGEALDVIRGLLERAGVLLEGGGET